MQPYYEARFKVATKELINTVTAFITPIMEYKHNRKRNE